MVGAGIWILGSYFTDIMLVGIHVDDRFTGPFSIYSTVYFDCKDRSTIYSHFRLFLLSLPKYLL